MSDRDPPRHVASDRLFSHGQEAHHTLPAELSNPTRPEDTSLGKSAHSSPYKSPLSALRTGEKWTSHTLADVLGLSPGIRGPSLLLSPLCSRAAAMSPGPGSGSGSVVHKLARRQPLMPLGDRMKATANMHSSQPLPEKPAWGDDAPGQASKANVNSKGRSNSSTGQSGQRISDKGALPAEQGGQDASSPLANKHSSTNAGPAALPVSQQLQVRDQDRQEQDNGCDTTRQTQTQSDQPAQPSLPCKQLSLHVTPTLEGDVQHSPPAQPKSEIAAEISADGHVHGILAEHKQPVGASVQATLPEQAVLPNVSDKCTGEAAEQTRIEDTAQLQAHHSEALGQPAAVSPGAALSPVFVARDLPETEVQHCPTQLLSPAGRSTLIETQAPSPSPAPHSAPATPAGAPQTWDSAARMLPLERTQVRQQAACETQLEVGASANPQPAHLPDLDPKQTVLQPQDCSACRPTPHKEDQGGRTAAGRADSKTYTPAATSVEGSCRKPIPGARDALTAATAAGGAKHERIARPSQAARAPVRSARTAGMSSPGPSEQVTDMAWPDSEEIERGVKEAGGDWEEARGLKLIHKFNNAILMGDPAGGVFIAVDKDDMHAMTRAVGVSHDDQSTEAWRRRLLSKRFEHGLLEWELEDAAAEPDHTDQLLQSPTPGISGLMCTAAEVSARQHTLASSGAVNSMPDSGGHAQKATAEDLPPAASHSGAQGVLQHAGGCDAPSQLLDQSGALQEERRTREAGVGIGNDLDLQDGVGRLDLRPAQHVSETCNEAGAAAAQRESHPEAKVPKQLAAPSSPDRKADERDVQDSPQQPEARSAGTDGSKACDARQQRDQQEGQERSVPAQNSAPAPTVDQLCPSLNLKFFTQAGAVQLTGAELPQHMVDQLDNMHMTNEAVPEQQAEKIKGAEAAGHAAALFILTETTATKGGPIASSSVPQAVAEQRLALCLQLDASQLETEMGTADQADAMAQEACITLIPDTMEPCSASKDTPKSKQQADQATPDQGCAEAQAADAAELEKDVQGMKGIPDPDAEAAQEGGRQESPPRNPARKARRRRDKQERAAAALRASTSRRRSQALMLSVPAVRRVAGAVDRPAQAVGAGYQAAASDEPLPADPDNPRPPNDPKKSPPGAAPAAADKHELGSVKGTKRLCKRMDADAAAAPVAVASMPASLADSTQQEDAPQHPGSPLHDRLAGDAAPSAVPRAESPLPDWLCNDAPGKASGLSAEASVSPLWLVDSEEAPPMQACQSTSAQQISKRQANPIPVRNLDLADPPSSLVGDSGEHGGQNSAPATAGGGQAGCRGSAAFGAWRSKSGFMQPPQLPAAALEQNHYTTSQHTYHDAFRFPDSQHLSRELPPGAPLRSHMPKRPVGPVQSDLQHQLHQQNARVASPKGKQRRQVPRTAELASRDDGHSIGMLKQRGLRRALHTVEDKDMRCHGRPQRSKRIPRKFSEFTQGQDLDAPPDNTANLLSPRHSPRKWSLMKAADEEPDHENCPKAASPASASASPASEEQGADTVSRSRSPQEAKQDEAAAPGGGKAAKLGCSKCRMSRKGCSVCRVKAGLAPLSTTRPSPRKPAQKRKASLAAVLPGRSAAGAWPGAAAASPGVLGRHARKRSLASLQLTAEAAKTPKCSGALAGRRLLLSNFEAVKERRALMRLIAEHDGIVLESIPQSLEEESADVVIAKKGGDRRMVCLLARVTGIPVLKPAFLDRCIKAGKWQTAGKADAWMLPREGHRVFDGLCIFLHGDAATLEPMRRLLPYAGARVTDSMEEQVDVRPAKRPCLEARRGTASQAKCDIVIVSHSEPLHKQQDLHSLLPQARCLGVPVRSMDWATEALWSGVIPESPAGPPPAPHPAPAPGRASLSPCRHAPQQPQTMAHAGAEALADGQAQAAGRPEEALHELIEDSQSLGAACPASPIFPEVTSARPSIGAGAEQEQESPPVMHCPASERPGHHKSSRAAPAAPACEARAPAPAHVPSLSWHGAPGEPPAGLGLLVTNARQYYDGFTKDGRVVTVGDAVELCLMPGDQAPRVARLQALWSQAANGGCKHMLAQCALFYRPSETGYYGSNASNELFASTHIEERLPLQRISAPCTVDMADGGKRGVHVAGTADYVCTFLYDHRTDQLGRLPGV